jgi:glycosyltransferase involved in cell wall biosynthesis
MLSILIPAYNYNVYPLVCELHKQCLECKIDFEILCQDDHSNSELNIENDKINALENASFSVNPSNFGRGKNINSLGKKAKHDWLLIMDCDTYPTQNDYIKKYADIIRKFDIKLVFGGIAYESSRPEKEKLLRWVYGQKRESIPLAKRNQNPNQTLTSNLLICREIFIQNYFNESITNYGYEDLLFLGELKSKNIIVKHIDNPTYHLGLENSKVFIKKTKTAIKNLVFIEELEKVFLVQTKIQKTYKILKFMRIDMIISLLFVKFQTSLEKHLLSNNPSLLIFDLYKLGYYCNIKSK